MEPVNTTNAPSAIGTYSQAIRQGEMLYVSGQIPLDPKTMELVSDDPVAQIIQVFKNIKAICNTGGTDLDGIVKLTVYLTDLTLFPLVNDQMSQLFKQPYPARAVVEVSKLPREALVEIDAIVSVS